MRIPVLLLAAGLLLLPSCSSSPDTSTPAANAAFVDTDDDGLPDTRLPGSARTARGAGSTAAGQDTFVDTDDDGLPNARAPR